MDTAAKIQAPCEGMTVLENQSIPLQKLKNYNSRPNKQTNKQTEKKQSKQNKKKRNKQTNSLNN